MYETTEIITTNTAQLYPAIGTLIFQIVAVVFLMLFLLLIYKFFNALNNINVDKLMTERIALDKYLKKKTIDLPKEMAELNARWGMQKMFQERLEEEYTEDFFKKKQNK